MFYVIFLKEYKSCFFWPKTRALCTYFPRQWTAFFWIYQKLIIFCAILSGKKSADPILMKKTPKNHFFRSDIRFSRPLKQKLAHVARVFSQKKSMICIPLLEYLLFNAIGLNFLFFTVRFGYCLTFPVFFTTVIIEIIGWVSGIHVRELFLKIKQKYN